MPYVRAFVAGFLSTLIFHQALFGLLYVAGVLPVPPYSLEPRAPFGVPMVLSLAFWGGVWGIPIWYLMRHATGKAYWIRAVVFGAVGPTAVALLFVFPLKNDWSFTRATQPASWVIGFLLNGAWGFGLALLMRGLRRVGL